VRSVCGECKGELTYTVGGETYSRETGVVLPGVYDGVLYWECPWCRAVRHRWPEGSELRARAELHSGRGAAPW
jgi:hypothetical protein